ncbi:MAG: cyclic nucleotide-binding protein [Hyphomicrobiales bacterium]|jgi:CRP-like cAMP-binding protein|nr:cyclic nucleotide-binding protein [Hyphomicrobiales bacterium]
MSQVTFKNRLIRKFSPDDFEVLRPALERVSLKVRDMLIRPNMHVQHVYFPESGQLSVLAKANNSEPIEVGMIGREGMSEMALSGQAPLQTIVQVAGEAWRVDRKLFSNLVSQSRELSNLMLRYQQFMTFQVSFTALSHGDFTVTERLARWLLMLHDRIDGNEVPLVHEFFSWMLAVRRAGVTEAMNELRAAGCILTARGKITILDRDALISMASGSYGQPEAEYQRLLGEG